MFLIIKTVTCATAGCLLSSFPCLYVDFRATAKSGSTCRSKLVRSNQCRYDPFPRYLSLQLTLAKETFSHKTHSIPPCFPSFRFPSLHPLS